MTEAAHNDNEPSQMLTDPEKGPMDCRKWHREVERLSVQEWAPRGRSHRQHMDGLNFLL
jgi:hypothetical protein